MPECISNFINSKAFTKLLKNLTKTVNIKSLTSHLKLSSYKLLCKLWSDWLFAEAHDPIPWPQLTFTLWQLVTPFFLSLLVCTTLKGLFCLSWKVCMIVWALWNDSTVCFHAFWAIRCYYTFAWLFRCFFKSASVVSIHLGP